jgi:hypothetical protein
MNSQNWPAAQRPRVEQAHGTSVQPQNVNVPTRPAAHV